MRVFISYRRDDSAGYAGRLSDQLSERFGADHVFRDVVDIAPGVDFVRALDDAVSTCDVLVAVIGARWLGPGDATGRRRLDDPADYVRRELAAALSRGIRVIPVLIERAAMPSETDLPDALRPLARRNAIELRDAAWDQDTARLMNAIEPGSRLAAAPPARAPLRLIGLVGVIALAAASAAWFAARPSAPPPPSTGPSRPPGSPAAGAGTPAGEAPLQPLGLPAGTRATVFGAGGDNVVYEIRGAGLGPAGGPLVLEIRMTNNAGYPVNFWDQSFRLLIDGVPHAPVGGLNEVVPARTAQDDRVVFAAAPGRGQTAVLRVDAFGTFADIALGDLQPSTH
jgi:hypothetical protein